MAIFQSVARDEELERIFSLPQRPIPDPTSPEALLLARELTQRLRRVPTPWPLRSPEETIFPVQALALKELWENRGLLALLRTGAGKSLLIKLAFCIMQPQRPMLVVPAAMIPDTKAAWKRFDTDWFGPSLSDITLLSFEKLAAPAAGARMLPDGSIAYPALIDRHSPDMLVCDEVHRLGATSSASTKRVGRYLEANPTTVFLGATGTFLRSSLKQGCHIAHWALHERSPLPCTWETAEAWADAVDARSGNAVRTHPGALLDELTPGEQRDFDSADSMEDARGVLAGMIGRRMFATAGVIGSAGTSLGIPARLDAILPEAEDPAIEEQYEKLITTWQTPDGQDIPDALTLARPLTTLGLGFILLQDPLPPEEYRQAASAWNKAVRNTIKYQPHLRLDTEFLVRDAVQRGGIPELQGLLSAWKSAQAHYQATTGLREPASKATWYSDEAIRNVGEWLQQGPGLVFVAYRALGHRLAKDLGVPYFGQEKKTADGRHVSTLKPGESAILSIHSCGTGLDGLQLLHHRALWTCSPTTQALGRLHRPLQEADCVYNDVYFSSAQSVRRYWRTVKSSLNFEAALSGSPSKFATFESTVPETVERSGHRWSAGTGGEDAGDV